jgi:hypothetical protein
VERKLASLALARVRQDGKLKVRQREELRRTLSAASELLAWDVIIGGKVDPVAEATTDVTRLTESGVRSMERDLADELASKKTEISQLEHVAKDLKRMAGEGGVTFPAEVEYSRSARDGSRGFVTKTETLTLGGASEAHDAAERIQKGLDGWTKLRDEMVEELKQRQRRVAEMKRDLSNFVEWSEGLLRDVLATLH